VRELKKFNTYSENGIPLVKKTLENKLLQVETVDFSVRRTAPEMSLKQAKNHDSNVSRFEFRLFTAESLISAIVWVKA
jgi:hypothetical protein